MKKSVIAAVYCRKRWLLGVATNNDDRKGKWCLPGGNIKHGEEPMAAAAREVKEETGIICTPIKVFNINKNYVVLCLADSLQRHKLSPNNEFDKLKLFRYSELRSLNIYDSTLKILRFLSKQRMY